MAAISRISAAAALLAVLAVLLLASSASAADTTSRVPTNFYDFVDFGCPNGTVTPSQADLLNKYKNKYCCKYFSDANPTKSTKYCGDKLLQVSGPGNFACAADYGGKSVHCCSYVEANRSLTTTGRFCNGNSGAASMASAATAVVVLAVIALFSSL